jgi:DNA-binding LytR/AlgR family response regulator
MASVPFGTRVVFVTAHEDRALDAFRAGAVDYVLKPVDRDRLAITVDRLEALVAFARSLSFFSCSSEVTLSGKPSSSARLASAGHERGDEGTDPQRCGGKA